MPVKLSEDQKTEINPRDGAGVVKRVLTSPHTKRLLSQRKKSASLALLKAPCFSSLVSFAPCSALVPYLMNTSTGDRGMPASKRIGGLALSPSFLLPYFSV